MLQCQVTTVPTLAPETFNAPAAGYFGFILQRGGRGAVKASFFFFFFVSDINIYSTDRLGPDGYGWEGGGYAESIPIIYCIFTSDLALHELFKL